MKKENNSACCEMCVNYVFDEEDPHDTGVNFEVGQNH